MQHVAIFVDIPKPLFWPGLVLDNPLAPQRDQGLQDWYYGSSLPVGSQGVQIPEISSIDSINGRAVLLDSQGCPIPSPCDLPHPREDTLRGRSG